MVLGSIPIASSLHPIESIQFPVVVQNSQNPSHLLGCTALRVADHEPQQFDSPALIVVSYLRKSLILELVARYFSTRIFSICCK